MSDKEIEKVLECCSKDEIGACLNCPRADEDREEICFNNDVKKQILDYINRLKAEKEQIRKETAKEILQDLKERSVWFANSGFDKEHFDEQFEEMCKTYGVEVEE